MNDAKPCIIVTNRIHDDVRVDLAAYGEVDVNASHEPWPQDEIIRRSRAADAILAFMTDRIDASMLTACPRLRVVTCALKGFDNFDVAACTSAGVWVKIVPDLLTAPTAQLAIGLAIGLGRMVREGDALVRSGDFAGWRPILYGSGLHVRSLRSLEWVLSNARSLSGSGASAAVFSALIHMRRCPPGRYLASSARP